MRLVHEKYGHLGIEKCAMQIQKNYWFPHMREKLNKFIRNCLKCIYYSAPSVEQRNLHSIDRTPEPFHTLPEQHISPHFGFITLLNNILKWFALYKSSFKTLLNNVLKRQWRKRRGLMLL